MLRILKLIYTRYTPRSVGDKLSLLRQHFQEVLIKFKFRKKIISHYRKCPVDITSEIGEVLGFLSTHTAQLFPYSFVKKYREEDIHVFMDEKNGLKWAMVDGKKVYVKRSWSNKKTRNYFKIMRAAQDVHSPHRYVTQNFSVVAGDTVADIGAAAGIFAISVVEQAEKLVLFEHNPEWIEPLHATFEPWKHKVVIVQKSLANECSEHTDTLDNFCDHNHLSFNFIKINVQGDEFEILEGAARTLEENLQTKLVISTYHHADDYEKFSAYLLRLGYRIKHSKGLLSTGTTKYHRLRFSGGV